MSSLRNELLDAIWDALLIREELGADDHLINSDAYRPGGSPLPNLEALYHLAFKRLYKSAQFWRKTRGPNGYFDLLDEYIP